MVHLGTFFSDFVPSLTLPLNFLPLFIAFDPLIPLPFFSLPYFPFFNVTFSFILPLFLRNFFFLLLLFFSTVLSLFCKSHLFVYLSFSSQYPTIFIPIFVSELIIVTPNSWICHGLRYTIPEFGSGPRRGWFLC